MVWGMPYVGSKNGIAKKLFEYLPKAECFVDLFGGGGAMTHYALKNGLYNKAIYNEINPLVCEGFRKAVNGEYKDEKRWISRENFQKLKNTDFYVYSCFSFGYSGEKYCYGKYLEPWKKALHYARVFNDFSLFEKMGIKTDGSSLSIEENYNEYKLKYTKWGRFNIEKYSIKSLQSLQNLQRLQNLQKLQRLQGLKSLGSLQIYNKDYQQVKIPKNSVVYCDIPYKIKDKRLYHHLNFDYNRFYEWCRNVPFAVYISEYGMPEDFKAVAEIPKRCCFAQEKNIERVEKIFCNKKQE